MDRTASIIAIGDEVLYGVTVNSNAACIADACVQARVRPVAHIVVSDDERDIIEAVTQQLLLGREVITTGGLGPTVDDRTRSAVATVFSRRLVRYDALFHELADRYGRTYPTIENQSLQPEGAVLLRNTVGTAPGLILEDPSLFPASRLFVLPGPPHEMRDVFFREVVPHFFQPSPRQLLVFRLIGVTEHAVDQALRPLATDCPSVVVGIYPTYELIRVHLSVADEAHESQLQRAGAFLRSSFPPHLFIDGASTLEEALYHALRDRGWTIATAESCTGGGVSARLASVPGISDVLLGGIVAYQESIKQSLLGVSETVLAASGVVSAEVTDLMAEKVQKLFGSDVACAVSGFFGPTGGTEQAPVGTVCASFRLPHTVFSERFVFHGSRESICERTIQAMIAKLILAMRQG